MEYFGISMWTIFGILLVLDLVVASTFWVVTKEFEAFGVVVLLGLIPVFFATVIAGIFVQSENTTAFDVGITEKYDVLVVNGGADIPPAGSTINGIQVVKDRLYLNCNAVVGNTPLDTRLFCGTMEELVQ